MAVITLYKYDQEIRNIPLGNYIDLSTQRVDLAESETELEEIISQAPTGTVLATRCSVENKINARIIGEIADDFDTNRRKFDLMTWEDSQGNGRDGDHTNVEDLRWTGRGTKLDLSQPGDLDIGTRLIVRIEDTDSNSYRYFRLLVHGTRGFNGNRYTQAFKADQTTLQFEELIKGRILVPLGIQEDGDGYRIVTTKNIPVQYITEDTSEIAWTIRPVGDEYFNGAGFYFENFPVVRVDFHPLIYSDGPRNVYGDKPVDHLPWIERVFQENRVCRSYSSSMYRIVIRHGIQVSKYGKNFFRNPPGSSASSPTTDSHRYAYTLFLADGANSDRPAILDFDPDVDVEDLL